MTVRSLLLRRKARVPNLACIAQPRFDSFTAFDVRFGTIEHTTEMLHNELKKQMANTIELTKALHSHNMSTIRELNEGTTRFERNVNQELTRLKQNFTRNQQLNNFSKALFFVQWLLLASFPIRLI